MSLMAHCALIRKLSDDVFIIFEHVPVARHMKEAVTRVHIVMLQGFLWDDRPENVVPTCSCPANRNLKDCCAGIMFALQHRTEFKTWYGTCYTLKRELLSRRLRADCDPVSALLAIISSCIRFFLLTLLTLSPHHKVY
jgi:hypothetical protein